MRGLAGFIRVPPYRTTRSMMSQCLNNLIALVHKHAGNLIFPYIPLFVAPIQLLSVSGTSSGTPTRPLNVTHEDHSLREPSEPAQDITLKTYGNTLSHPFRSILSSPKLNRAIKSKTEIESLSYRAQRIHLSLFDLSVS